MVLYVYYMLMKYEHHIFFYLTIHTYKCTINKFVNVLDII